jgi:hypothetical protein
MPGTFTQSRRNLSAVLNSIETITASFLITGQTCCAPSPLTVPLIGRLSAPILCKSIKASYLTESTMMNP